MHSNQSHPPLTFGKENQRGDRQPDRIIGAGPLSVDDDGAILKPPTPFGVGRPLPRELEAGEPRECGVGHEEVPSGAVSHAVILPIRRPSSGLCGLAGADWLRVAEQRRRKRLPPYTIPWGGWIS